MQINLEKLSGLEHKLNVTIPAADIESKIAAKLHEYGAKAKMPGFRPGKVPFELVQKQYQGSARADVIDNLIRDSYTKAISQEKLNPAGFPKIDIVSSKPNEQFVYNATFEVYPEIKLNDFKQIEVEKPMAAVSDEDVNGMLLKMQKNYVTWQELKDVARKSQIGDQLIVDFTAVPHVPGKDLPAKTEQNVKFVLGDGSMWADFEKPLFGVSVGEEKKYFLELPATHMDKELANNRVEFTVKVQKISEPILPALDDAFAEKMGVKEGGLEKLRQEVRGHLEQQLQVTLKRLFKEAIMAKLIDNNPIEVPKILIANELKRFEEQWYKRFAEAPTKIEKVPEFPRDDFVKKAKSSVTLGLLFASIIETHQLAVTPQEIRKKMEDLMINYYEDRKELINKYLNDQKHELAVKTMLLEEKVVDYLASQINVKEKSISYQDAMTAK